MDLRFLLPYSNRINKMNFQIIFIFIASIFFDTMTAQTNTINISWWYVSGWQGAGSAYVVNGEDDPIIYLYRGQSYLFNINTFGHPIIIDGVIDTVDEGSMTITISENTPNILNYHCLYTCEHPNGQHHNCWPIDPLHDFDAGNLVIVQQSPASIKPDSHSYLYGLEQNHPNPFNPTTKIKYQIPELSFVTLKIYDVLRKEITTLTNKEKHTGSYEVEFNASTLPSGIYFYRLQAGNFVKTKKMILLK